MKILRDTKGRIIFVEYSDGRTYHYNYKHRRLDIKQDGNLLETIQNARNAVHQSREAKFKWLQKNR